MLSYRHAFHAGNHADILKHYLFSLTLDYFNQKDKPYCVVDTHAGAGMYRLNSDYSKQNLEYKTGISKLLAAKTLPASLTTFTALIRSFNANENLNLYPGSPKIAEQYLRIKDQLRLFELHPSDNKILQDNFSAANTKQTKIAMSDGFEGLKACLPPSSKRGIVIIDPPYEDKTDYQRVVSCLQDSLKRFATGTYLIWYPLLQKPEQKHMINHLQALNQTNWLNITLQVNKPSADGVGMYGSGMYLINPPWILPQLLTEALPFLQQILCDPSEGASHLDFRIT